MIDKKFIETLEQESRDWVQKGLLSEQSRTTLLARYQSSSSSPSRKPISVMLTLGALLVGVGVILFFASNWKFISPLIKLILLTAAFLGCEVWGSSLSAGKTYPRMGRALLFLGAILYGATIFLVAQAFNINEHWPKGVLFWGLGVLPLAWLYDSKSIGSIAVVVFTLWLGSELSFYLELYEPTIVRHYGVAYLFWGVILIGLGTVFETMKSIRLGRLIAGFGVCFLFLTLFPFTFRDIYRDLEIFEALSAGKPVLMGLGTGATLLVGLMVVRSLQTSWKNSLLGTITGGVFLGLGWWLLTCSGSPIAFLTIALNLIYFLMVLFLIYGGTVSSRVAYLNLGLVFFGIFVIGRYFDFAWKYMERSLAFILGGVLLLGLGFFLERGRRHLIKRIAL